MILQEKDRADNIDMTSLIKEYEERFLKKEPSIYISKMKLEHFQNFCAEKTKLITTKRSELFSNNVKKTFGRVFKEWPPKNFRDPEHTLLITSRVQGKYITKGQDYFAKEDSSDKSKYILIDDDLKKVSRSKRSFIEKDEAKDKNK